MPACSSGPDTSALAEDLIDGLCGLLLLPFMPTTALWQIGWLLRQLLPASQGGGPRLTEQQYGLLESAMRLSRQFLMAEMNGELAPQFHNLTGILACSSCGLVVHGG